MKKIYFKNGDDAVYMVQGEPDKETDMLHHLCQRLRTSNWIRRTGSKQVAVRDKNTGEKVMQKLKQNGPGKLWGYPTGILFGSFLNHAPCIESISSQEAIKIARENPDAH